MTMRRIGMWIAAALSAATGCRDDATSASGASDEATADTSGASSTSSSIASTETDGGATTNTASSATDTGTDASTQSGSESSTSTGESTGSAGSGGTSDTGEASSSAGATTGPIVDACPDDVLGSSVPIEILFDNDADGAAIEHSCSSGGNGRDHSVAWTAPHAGTFDILARSQSEGVDPILSVLAGGCDGAELGCNDDLEPSVDVDAGLRLALAADTAVTIVVSGFDASDVGDFRLEIHEVPGPAPGLDCCAHDDAPGCEREDVTACVCGQDPNCCEDAWSGACVQLAVGACGALCPQACADVDQACAAPLGDCACLGCVDDGVCADDEDCTCADCVGACSCDDDGTCAPDSEDCSCGACTAAVACSGLVPACNDFNVASAIDGADPTALVDFSFPIDTNCLNGDVMLQGNPRHYEVYTYVVEDSAGSLRVGLCDPEFGAMLMVYRAPDGSAHPFDPTEPCRNRLITDATVFGTPAGCGDGSLEFFEVVGAGEVQLVVFQALAESWGDYTLSVTSPECTDGA